MSRDQKFFDLYSLVISILAAFALAIFVLAMKMSDLTQGIYTQDAAEYQARIQSHIQPFGQVYLPGEEQAAASPILETTEEPEPVAAQPTGPQIYNDACLACHGTGAGGAPILGDTADWAPRIAQGTDVLNDHAINGIGVMPAKGGRVDLPDQAIIDAVAYIVAESQ